MNMKYIEIEWVMQQTLLSLVYNLGIENISLKNILLVITIMICCQTFFLVGMVNKYMYMLSLLSFIPNLHFCAQSGLEP